MRMGRVTGVAEFRGLVVLASAVLGQRAGAEERGIKFATKRSNERDAHLRAASPRARSRHICSRRDRA